MGAPAADAPPAFPVGLVAMVLAIALALAACSGEEIWARRVASRHVEALALPRLPGKSQGLVMQEGALATGHTLPLYGSSELYCCGRPYRATDLFTGAPTGFDTVAAGRNGTAEAALGDALRGKKILVSISPTWFFERHGLPADAYAANFSPETMQTLMQHVDDDATRGGIISSYEFAWSSRGPDGLPRRLFDRSDGRLDEQTLKAWQAYDVHTVLSNGGASRRDALAGKLNIYCGARDSLFYNEPTAALCRFLRRSRYAAVCRLVPGRTHDTVLLPTTLYPLGLRHLVVAEAATMWRRRATCDGDGTDRERAAPTLASGLLPHRRPDVRVEVSSHPSP